MLEVKPGLMFCVGTLRELLPDVETLLFFGKVYDLDYRQLSELMSRVLNSALATELFAGDHSTELQDYVIEDLGPGVTQQGLDIGEVVFNPVVPHGEILPELWKSCEVEVAKSIQQVADKMASTIGMLPGKQGRMVFNSMLKLNAKRPTLGDYRARVHHDPLKENLVILDVSGSMTATTIKTIIGDVVSMSYMASAHLAIVSNTCTYWTPGAYDVDGVLAKCEFGGTHYETLAPLFHRDWGQVITVADYDSSPASLPVIAKSKGRIDQVLDISLVNRPTFLAHAVGQLADHVRPLLIGNSQGVLRG